MTNTYSAFINLIVKNKGCMLTLANELTWTNNETWIN